MVSPILHELMGIVLTTSFQVLVGQWIIWADDARLAGSKTTLVSIKLPVADTVDMIAITIVLGRPDTPYNRDRLPR
jgi:hypothetical protein